MTDLLHRLERDIGLYCGVEGPVEVDINGELRFEDEQVLGRGDSDRMTVISVGMGMTDVQLKRI